MTKKYRRTSKRSKGMHNRVSKLETQLTPLLKTFEQRFVDGNPTLQADVAVPIGGLMYEFGKLAPTTEDNSWIAPGGAAQDQLPQNVRIGSKITIKSFHLRGAIKCGLGNLAGDADNQVRLLAVLFPDYGSVAAGATPGLMLQRVLQNYDGGAVGSTFAPSSAIYSFYKARVDQNTVLSGNAVDMIKYKVLYDKKFNLVNSITAFTAGTGSGGSNSKESWRHDFDINLRFPKGLVCEYNKQTDVNPAINHIMILAVSDSAIANHPTISVVSRMRYIDA